MRNLRLLHLTAVHFKRFKGVTVDTFNLTMDPMVIYA